MSGNFSELGEPWPGVAYGSRQASSTAICSGARFATYVVRELIGVGDTASVYRAHDARLLREVALKILTSGALAGPAGLARFLHEARMAAAIRHPNVVSIFDVGVHDGAPYIVMELLAGEDLDARLRAVRALSEQAVIEMALPLAAGLIAVHDAGVVHRDLKPSNVFLARGPGGTTEPKLLDFGVSKQTRDSLRLTTAGRQRWAAMPLYTAPEVLLGGEATFRSDQYSLGVLLYECVTGTNPFRAETAVESIELITAGQAPRFSPYALTPSRRLARIIERAMSPEPAERFEDLRELGRALIGLLGHPARQKWQAVFDGSPLAPPSQRSARGARNHASRAPGRRPAWWLLAATAVGCCAVGAAVSAWYFLEPARGPLLGTSSLETLQGEARPLVAASAAGVAAAGLPTAAPASGSSPACPAPVVPGGSGAAHDARMAMLAEAPGTPGVPSAIPGSVAPVSPPPGASMLVPGAPVSSAPLASVPSALPLASVAGAIVPEPPGSPGAEPPAELAGGDVGAGLAQPDPALADAGSPQPDRTGAGSGPAGVGGRERGTNGALIFD